MIVGDGVRTGQPNFRGGAMNECAALLRAICDNPDDDTPRLVFADWLQEQGVEDRAEFIRLQVRFAELLRHGAPDAAGLARRASALWARHGLAWRAGLPKVRGVTWHDAFYRGFVEHVMVSSDALLVKHAAALFAQPIRHLVIRHFEGAAGFAALPGLARLRTLTLANNQGTPEAVHALLRCDSLPESVLLFCHLTLARNSALYNQLRAKFGDRLRA
jgi:uncharacterized protein (TIGR02996 family)